MQIKSKRIEFVDVNSIIENPKNANRHSIEQIKRLEKLIKYQGFRNPMVISNRTGFLLAGHGRLEAAKNLGMEKVPVIKQDFENEAQEYEYLVSDNEIARWAQLDLQAIYDELESNPEIDVEMLAIEDFSLPSLEELDPKTDENEVPEVEHPITQKGDVWVLGKHRLMCGDSSSIDNIQKVLKGEKADLVFTDPPYRMAVEGGSNQMVGKSAAKLGEAIKHLCDFEPEDFLNALPTVFDKNKMNAYIFCNKDLVPDYLQWGLDAGYNFNILFWKKPNAIPLGGNHRPDVEYLLLFRRSAIWNNGLKDVNYSKCLEFGRESSTSHPTMKPVELIENEVKISSNKESVVFEFFMGSGSTMIACEKTGRKCYGLELDEKYCDIVVNRWQNYTGKKAVLEATGQSYEDLQKERL